MVSTALDLQHSRRAVIVVKATGGSCEFVPPGRPLPFPPPPLLLPQGKLNQPPSSPPSPPEPQFCTHCAQARPWSLPLPRLHFQQLSGPRRVVSAYRKRLATKYPESPGRGSNAISNSMRGIVERKVNSISEVQIFFGCRLIPCLFSWRPNLELRRGVGGCSGSLVDLLFLARRRW